MLTHKNLLLAAKNIIASIDASLSESQTNASLDNIPQCESLKELKEAIEKSESFLKSSKSFEYEGNITIPHSSVIKLKDISMDLDDVFKMLSNKKSDIKGKGGIYIIWEDEKPSGALEVKVEEKPIDSTPLPINLMEGCE